MWAIIKTQVFHTELKTLHYPENSYLQEMASNISRLSSFYIIVWRDKVTLENN